jgi:CheY-like chemotaxis protein
MAQKKTVLAIDDDADVRESVKLVLEKSGFTVILADSGQKGIAQASQVHPDVILCDLMMEQVDAGVTTAQAIKKMNPAIPIVLMSSVADTMGLNMDINDQGFAGSIQKPFEPAALVRMVTNLVH